MSKRLEEALAQEIYKHDLFPCILHYREQSESFEYIAEQLNNDGIPTWRGRPWCRQNLERTFKNYWRSRGGMYSWRQHGDQIKAMQDALGLTQAAQEESIAPAAA